METQQTNTSLIDKTLKNGERATVYFPDGSNYRGEWWQNRRHGNGCMIYKNGDKYFGKWMRNKREGLGAFYRCRGREHKLVYTGEWHCDQPSGHGVYYDAHNNCYYEGQWAKGKRNGRGRVMSHGARVPLYEGEWVNDLREGRGTERYANGDTFVGHFIQDKKHGCGTLYFSKQRKKLDGIWNHGTCVAGSFSALHPGTMKALPVLELREPDAILSDVLNSS